MIFLTHIFTILHTRSSEGSTGASSWQKKTNNQPQTFLMLLSGSCWAAKIQHSLCTPTVGTKEFVQAGKSSEPIMLSKIWNWRVARSVSSGATWLACVLLGGHVCWGPQTRPSASRPPFSWSGTRAAPVSSSSPAASLKTRSLCKGRWKIYTQDFQIQLRH